MSDVFQIPIEGEDDKGTSRGWAKFDLTASPFPASGHDSPVLYTRHIADELRRLNRWIESAVAGRVAPMAMFGSLGVGKSHVLHFLEGGLSGNPATPVLRVNLTERGMTRITLADLVLQGVPRLGKAQLRPVEALLGADRGTLRDALSELRDGDPLREPLQRLCDMEGDDLERGIETLDRWMRREQTSPAQRARIGLAGVLEREGQALRCLANLLAMARAVGLVSTWFVLIDQLEEFWRAGVVTPSRRARFLTDLRTLIDLGLAGSPVAVLLAWNTTIEVPSHNVEKLLQRDYLALWQRFPAANRIDLPMLGADDVWPFAERYLMMAGVAPEATRGRRTLYETLEARRDAVIAALDRANPDHLYSARQVLEAWRDEAERVVADA